MTSELMEWEDQKFQIAISIAVESGAVKACRMHDGFLYAGSSDFTKTYKIAAARQKRGDFDDLFENQKELTDLIKEIIEDNSYESRCQRCNELMEKD